MSPRLIAAVFLFGAPVAAQQQTIAGVVRDSLSGTPIPRVTFSTGGAVAHSDRSGKYVLVVAADTVTVTVQHTGYGTRRLRAALLTNGLWLAREPELLTELTVSAAPVPAHVGQASALGSNAVDREAIGARPAQSFADVLAGLEGVSAQRPGAWGSKTFVRGLGGERVTILLDGNRLNRACNNGMDAGIATIDPGTIERVELISGPGSVLYGSGNIGGVINVVSRRASTQPISGEIRVEASSAVPGASVGGQISVFRPTVEFLLSADAAAYDDYRAPSGLVGGSSYRNGTANARLALKPAPGHRLELRAERYLGRDIGYPAMAGAQIPREDRLLTAVDYGWQVRRGALEGLSAKIYRQGLDHDMEVTMTMTGSNGMPMTSLTEAKTTSVTYGARGQAQLKPTAMSRVDAGAEITQWRADGTRWTTRGAGSAMASTLALRSWPDVTVTDAGLFGQGEWLLGTTVALSVGGRLDAIRNQAEATSAESQWVGTGNVGIKLYPFEGLVTRAILGRGYRIADPTELHGLLIRPDGFIYEGNPGLKTESGANLELGASYSSNDLDAGVTLFRNDLRNLISSVLLPDSTIAGYRVRQFANLNRARVQGVSAQTTVRFTPTVSVRGVAGYARGENRDNGSVLPMIPPVEGQLTFRVAPAARVRWIEVEGRWAGKQTRAALAQAELATPGFVIANLRGSVRVAGADLVPGVENLFNKTYRNHLDPVRLARPGRNFYLKVQRAF